ncbi:hypothetical protein IC582_022887 [Cucumis melo]
MWSLSFTHHLKNQHSKAINIRLVRNFAKVSIHYFWRHKSRSPLCTRHRHVTLSSLALLSKPEIRDFGTEVIVQKNVVWFDVKMQNPRVAALMQVL